jgi:protein-S-isoprenylcysteine O-methyltransferase Ste14
VLFIYLVALIVFMVAFVRFWEEWTMRRHYGAAFEAYCKQVPAWLPRLPRRES